MTELESSVAKQVAQAAAICHLERTGRAPESVAVVLSGDTLVVTLHGALSPAERTLALTTEGAEKLTEFHRRLFATSLEPLRERIRKIIGSDVLEATAELEASKGTVVQVFTTGTMVQVFLLSGNLAASAWSGAARGGNG
jgi:uncharacterized protein YbcI